MLVHARRSPNTLVKKLSRTCDRAVRTRAGRTCRMRDLRPSLARSSARGIEPTHSRVCAEARGCVQCAAAPAELHYRPSACEEADAHAVVGTAIHQMKISRDIQCRWRATRPSSTLVPKPSSDCTPMVSPGARRASVGSTASCSAAAGLPCLRPEAARLAQESAACMPVHPSNCSSVKRSACVCVAFARRAPFSTIRGIAIASSPNRVVTVGEPCGVRPTAVWLGRRLTLLSPRR